MRLGLIFTDDWELFGNGSGDLRERQIEPASRFMEISEKYGAKYTFMAEVGEYWAFKKWSGKYPEMKNWAEDWENTLKNAVSRGHDVQLHLHPQWDGAVYQEKEWKLNLQYWSLPTLPPEQIRRLIRRGINTLEKLLKPVKPEYRCCCFRSGAWMMQPGNPLIGILTDEGIESDSSVVWGDRISYKYGKYDYTSAFSNLFPWWADQKEISRRETRTDRRQFLEIPIYTERGHYPSLYPRLVKKYRERSRWMEEIYPAANHPFTEKDTHSSSPSFLPGIWNRLFSPRKVLFDHGQLSANHLMAMIERIRKRISHLKGDGILPVMSITHSKGVYFYDEYEKFLKTITSHYDNEVVFFSFSEANAYLRKIESLPLENQRLTTDN